MVFMLQDAGVDLTTATNGEEAYERMERGERSDLYLPNHTFPDVSGVSLSLAIRELDRETPVLFLRKAARLRRSAGEAVKAGANDYLVKPRDVYDVADHRLAKWTAQARQKGD